MSRRGNNIYHRADGRWEGRHYSKGTHKYQSVYGKTYTEAREKLERLRQKALVPSVRCNLLVTDIMKMWLESRRNHIKESSYACYRSKLEFHILPFFAGMKYSSLDVDAIEQFAAAKKAEHLSSKYISDMITMMKSAAKWAEMTKGYANQIRYAAPIRIQPKEMTVLSGDERKRLLKTIDSTHDHTSCGVLLTLYTGLRIGELCALQWKDIDFDARILHITKTVQRIRVYGEESKTAVKITEPKSATSLRVIPLPEFLVDALAEYRGDGQEYITSGKAVMTEPRSFLNRYKALLKKAGIPSRKFHCIRHTFSTHALQLGFDVKTLSEILGHANPNITMRVYVHTSMERKKECMERLKELI